MSAEVKPEEVLSFRAESSSPTSEGQQQIGKQRLSQQQTDNSNVLLAEWVNKFKNKKVPHEKKITFEKTPTAIIPQVNLNDNNSLSSAIEQELREQQQQEDDTTTVDSMEQFNEYFLTRAFKQEETKVKKTIEEKKKFINALIENDILMQKVFKDVIRYYNDLENSPKPKFGARSPSKSHGFLSSYLKRFAIKKYMDNTKKKDQNCFRRKNLFQNSLPSEPQKKGDKSKSSSPVNKAEHDDTYFEETASKINLESEITEEEREKDRKVYGNKVPMFKRSDIKERIEKLKIQNQTLKTKHEKNDSGKMSQYLENLVQETEISTIENMLNDAGMKDHLEKTFGSMVVAKLKDQKKGNSPTSPRSRSPTPISTPISETFSPFF